MKDGLRPGRPVLVTSSHWAERCRSVDWACLLLFFCSAFLALRAVFSFSLAQLVRPSHFRLSARPLCSSAAACEGCRRSLAGCGGSTVLCGRQDRDDGCSSGGSGEGSDEMVIWAMSADWDLTGWEARCDSNCGRRPIFKTGYLRPPLCLASSEQCGLCLSPSVCAGAIHKAGTYRDTIVQWTGSRIDQSSNTQGPVFVTESRARDDARGAPCSSSVPAGTSQPADLTWEL